MKYTSNCEPVERFTKVQILLLFNSSSIQLISFPWKSKTISEQQYAAFNYSTHVDLDVFNKKSVELVETGPFSSQFTDP